MTTASDRRPRPFPSILLGLCLLGLLGLAFWTMTRRKSDHWEEVARAQALLNHNRPDLAFQAVSGIRDEQPGAAEGLTLAARALLLRGTIAPARKILERSLEIKNEQPEAAKMLAAIYLAGGDSKRAIALLRQSAELDPRDFRPWFALGRVYHNLGEMLQSRDAYTEALNRTPPPAEARQARLGRVRALLDAHLDDEASADLNRLLQDDPSDTKALALAARQAIDLGRIDDAIASADRALATGEKDFDALLARARARFQTKQLAGAIEDLEPAIKINPNDVAALQLLGQCQLALGRRSDAEATLARAERSRDRMILMDRLTKEIDEKPLDPEPRCLLGEAAMEGGMETLAYQCFQAAIDISPGYSPAEEGLRKLRQERGFDASQVEGTRPEFGGIPPAEH